LLLADREANTEITCALLAVKRYMRVRRRCAMRQIGDLLVWFVLVAVLAGVVYLTPKFARYMSTDDGATQDHPSTRRLALNVVSSQAEP
jgi:hypothetical protein